METQRIVMGRLCLEQLKAQHIQFDKDEIMKRINQIYKKEDLKDGYAPFCKHLIIESFTAIPPQTVKITKENKGAKIKGKYNTASIQKYLGNPPTRTSYLNDRVANIKQLYDERIRMQY